MLRAFGLFMTLCTLHSFALAQFCQNDARLTPENYLLHYHPIRKEIRSNYSENSNHDVFYQLRECGLKENCHDPEICAHNRFLFTDFIFYFELLEKFETYSNIKGENFIRSLMHLRDSLYVSWLDELEFGAETGYYEWEGEDLKGLSFDQFQNLGSQKFRWLETSIRRMNAKPPKRKAADRAAHEILAARTPFSAIMSTQIEEVLKSRRAAEAVACLHDMLIAKNCDENYFLKALECTAQDTAMSLKILGVMSSQRMYLIRDYKAWLEQNRSESEFNTQFSVIKASSSNYFMMETFAADCDWRNIYPVGIDGSEHSKKAYHFWSTATLAYELAQLGFDREEVIKAATKPAKKYKFFIRFPGLVHNLVLRNRWNASTVGDYRKVREEQRLGATWGGDLYREGRK